MSDAARLASLAYRGKPSGMQRTNFQLPNAKIAQIIKSIPNDIESAAYSAAVSYVEALSGIRNGRASWAIVKLYYSCFYCIRTLLLADGIVPFNCGQEYILDSARNTFEKGGRSSHHWNWPTFSRIRRLSRWIYSIESRSAYETMRKYRENANYTHPFTDPKMPSFLNSLESELSKRVRTYRDDDEFFLTYLPEHLPLAYVTKLIYEVDLELTLRSIKLQAERRAHLISSWSFADRCPIATSA